MILQHFVLLQILSLVITHQLTEIQSLNAVCEEHTISDENKIYKYNLAASSDKYPHGVLSEDGYYKVSSNGTVVWFQLCDAMIFNHDPPRCFDCFDCGGSARCGIGCSALMSNDFSGYPVCTTIGLTSTVTTDLIDNKSPHMGLVIKMWYNGPQFNCSLSVSVVCDSKQVQGPTALGKVGLCDFVSALKLKISSASQVTQLRHPSGCAKIGIDVIPNLELWASLPRKARNGFTSLVRRFRGPSEGYQTSYSRANF
ncbi:hypothetical protein Tco_0461737 [Tanacetum coccineum]